MKKLLGYLVTLGSFILGLFTYRYFLDKPETVVNNHYDKIKNKGTGNSVDVTSTTEVTNTATTKKEKRIEKRIERLQNKMK